VSRPAAPSLLGVIGWSMLAGALALLLSGWLGFKLVALARTPGALMVPHGPGEGIDLKGLIRPVEGALLVLSWVQVLLALPSAVISVEFLKRKRWARAGMEGLTWAVILFTAALPLLVVPFWNGLLREALLLGPGSPLPGPLRMVTLSAAVLLVVLLEIPLFMMLRSLRSSGLRRACVL
jgi:hypothetical protein